MELVEKVSTDVVVVQQPARHGEDLAIHIFVAQLAEWLALQIFLYGDLGT